MNYINDNRCFACGRANAHGLKLEFNWDGDERYTDFYTDPRYQGYQGVLHGGIIATILDEVMGNHLVTRGFRVVTASIDIRYKKMVPTGMTVRFMAREEDYGHNMFVMSGKAVLPGGKVAAEATAKFMQLRRKQSKKEV
jgi:uncharacterized protein (TIGR00369 family)